MEWKWLISLSLFRGHFHDTICVEMIFSIPWSNSSIPQSSQLYGFFFCSWSTISTTKQSFYFCVTPIMTWSGITLFIARLFLIVSNYHTINQIWIRENIWFERLDSECRQVQRDLSSTSWVAVSPYGPDVPAFELIARSLKQVYPDSIVTAGKWYSTWSNQHNLILKNEIF